MGPPSLTAEEKKKRKERMRRRKLIAEQNRTEQNRYRFVFVNDKSELGGNGSFVWM